MCLTLSKIYSNLQWKYLFNKTIILAYLKTYSRNYIFLSSLSKIKAAYGNATEGCIEHFVDKKKKIATEILADPSTHLTNY